MNKLEYNIGNRFQIGDCDFIYDCELIGFIINQIPVKWKDQSSYRNHANQSKYLVLKFKSPIHKNQERYCLAEPRLYSYFPTTNSEKTPAYSTIEISAIEYSDSVEGLIKKLKENWAFTKELSYDAIYKEGYKSE